MRISLGCRSEMIRLDPKVQPNMVNGVYFKTWTGSVNGVPSTGRGGAGGALVLRFFLRDLCSFIATRLRFERYLEEHLVGQRHGPRARVPDEWRSHVSI